jgi:protein-tyrosine phosphatase
MDGYIDMHCHILPGVDDGAENMAETLKMLEIAYKSGTRSMIATPHYHPVRGHAKAERILEALEKTREAAKERFPGLKLYPGQEMYYSHDALDALRRKELLTLGGGAYVLVEFSPGTEVRKIKESLSSLVMTGHRPILAHVERYAHLVEDLDSVEELADAGIYLQVNSQSLTGNPGWKRKRFIKALLKEDLVSFIGSDAHDSRRRTPCLDACAQYITKKFGKEMAQRIFCENPGKVIEDKSIS